MRKLCIFLVVLMCMFVFLNSGSAEAESNKVYKMRLQSWAPSGDPTYGAAVEFTEICRKASNGRLDITPYTSGSIVPGTQEFEALMDGGVEMIHTSPSWTTQYIPAAIFFNQYPTGPTANQLEMWMKVEGRKIAQDLYTKFGVHYVGILSLSPAEIFLQSAKPIESVADIKGLKVRLGAPMLNAIFKKMGASPVILPGSQIYESLQRGIVDAFEYVNPTVNWSMGFHEVAKYIYLDPSRAPVDTQCIYVNAKVWDELPEDLQKIVELATDQVARTYYANAFKEDVETIQKFIDAGCIVSDVSQDIIDLLEEKTQEYINEQSEKDETYKMVYEKLNSWKEICERFSVR